MSYVVAITADINVKNAIRVTWKAFENSNTFDLALYKVDMMINFARHSLSRHNR